MTVEQLVVRFPEIPSDLRETPELRDFARTFAVLLSAARAPSPCSTEHDAGNHYYMKLIGPLAIYGYGLASRESVLSDLGLLLQRHRSDPDGFAASLLPDGVSTQERRGPGCG